jgi:hypothetical protein
LEIQRTENNEKQLGRIILYDLRGNQDSLILVKKKKCRLRDQNVAQKQLGKNLESDFYLTLHTRILAKQAIGF